MGSEVQDLGLLTNDIAAVARGMGLDFYPVNFEIVPAEALYTFGAYGMPVRFSHWSFGKAFFRMKFQYDLNLSRIYELVINTNPAYAFLLEGNRLIQNKLVIGHVYAHVDFFKNNQYFSRTPNDMIERMRNHADKIREYEVRFGQKKVEQTLDSVLAIQEHVDGRFIHEVKKNVPRKNTSIPYGDLWGDPVDDEGEEPIHVVNEDLLLYIIKFAPGLEDWQRDILSIVREESIYFYPQVETKIINEGWATFWHSRIMRELELSNAEYIEFALMHSQVVQPSLLGLNPYYLGAKIWEYLAKTKSLENLFEIRESENDLSFIRNYLNRELVEDLNLYNFRKVGAVWQVTENEWEKVRDNLVLQLVHGGYPRIVALGRDFEGRGGLLLKHCHEGIDLDVVYLEKTLALVYNLWGKLVAIETIMDGKTVIYECSNGLVSRRQRTLVGEG